MIPKQGEILAKINTPDDVRKLPEDDLTQLCTDIRRFIIDVVSKHPGHFGASLGVVELSVALHYVFNTPYDKLIWDVGHQAYGHKIITGRKHQFHTNRKYKGLSGFPKMSESKYDAFGTGHSSTSISAALGMAVASAKKDQNGRQHIAVIGDGAMTAGMAMEALNNAGVTNANLLIILNDNGIAIDKNVGALKEYLTDIVTSRTYNRFKDAIWYLLGGGSKYGKNTRAIVKQVGNAVKSSIFDKSNLFESFNFRYFGPTDGHDVIHLIKLLRDLKKIEGPKLLHIITVKGKGFSYAEKNQTRFHSPGLFDKKTGELIQDPCHHKPPKYQFVFGKTIIELAEKNPDIVGVTPAMPTGCSLNMMMAKMPDRAFDVGIAEQHAVTFSAGMAAQGLTPFCNIYSSFMQRAYDQIVHDVALQNLNVVFCLDRGGVVGEDGATHHGVYDLAYLRSIPNFIIASPMDEIELRNLMFTAQHNKHGPFAIRYPKGRGVNVEWKQDFTEYTVGKGETVKEGEDLAVLTIGHVGNYIKELHGKLEMKVSIAHYNMRFLKPIDEELLHSIFTKFKKIISIEDGTIVGGLGSAILEFISDHGYNVQVKRLGIPDHFIEQGTIEELHHECGIDAEGVAKTIEQMMQTS